MTFEPGDHLISGRTYYTHHGIYIGDGKVIHYSGLADGLSAGPVEITSLSNFSQGKIVTVRQYKNPPFKGREVVARAKKRLGENKYDLHANNCEHFCSWAILGSAECRQVEVVEDVLSTVFPGAAIATRIRKHAAQDHKGSAVRPALESAGEVAACVVFPVVTPFVVGYKVLKWLSR